MVDVNLNDDDDMGRLLIVLLLAVVVVHGGLLLCNNLWWFGLGETGVLIVGPCSCCEGTGPTKADADWRHSDNIMIRNIADALFVVVVVAKTLGRSADVEDGQQQLSCRVEGQRPRLVLLLGLPKALGLGWFMAGYNIWDGAGRYRKEIMFAVLCCCCVLLHVMDHHGGRLAFIVGLLSRRYFCVRQNS